MTTLDMIIKFSKCVAAQNEDNKSKQKQTKQESKFVDKSSSKKIIPNIPQPCCKHDGKHDWRNCPDNPNNKRTNQAKKDDDSTSKLKLKSKPKPSNLSKQKSGESFALKSRSNCSSLVKFDCNFMLFDDEYEDELDIIIQQT